MKKEKIDPFLWVVAIITVLIVIGNVTTAIAQPLWLDIAQRELKIGVVEYPGNTHNKRIISYHQTTKLKATDDETPWCASFVNWVMVRAGFEGTNSAWARSWLDWGIVQDNPKFGSVVIFSRGKNPLYGHVGFYLGELGDDIIVLGGNQSDAVSIVVKPKRNVLGYRWPNKLN